MYNVVVVVVVVVVEINVNKIKLNICFDVTLTGTLRKTALIFIQESEFGLLVRSPQLSGFPTFCDTSSDRGTVTDCVLSA